MSEPPKLIVMYSTSILIMIIIYADLINHHRVKLMVSEIQEIIIYLFHCILRNDANDEHVQVSVLFLQSLYSCNKLFSLLIMIQNLFTVLFLWPLTWANKFSLLAYHYNKYYFNYFPLEWSQDNEKSLELYLSSGTW